MGCRRGIWGAEAGCRTQEMGCGFCRNAEVGFRVQVWDEGAGQGMLQHQSTTAQPQLCAGILQHPWRWGVRARSRETQTSKEKIIAFQSHTDILQLVPHLGCRSRPFGHICPPDVPGRGTEPLWMGNLPTPLCAGQVGNAALPYHTCSAETPGWDQGAAGRKDGMGPIQPLKWFSLQFSSCPVAGGGGNETQQLQGAQPRMAQCAPVRTLG